MSRCTNRFRDEDDCPMCLSMTASTYYKDKANCENAAHELLVKTRKCLADVLEEVGYPHEDGCPEDDTCECLLIAQINEVLRNYP